MPRPRKNKPDYCHHTPSGLAYVRIDGKFYWLGKHGSQVSRDKYDVVIGQWKLQGRTLAPALTAAITSSPGFGISRNIASTSEITIVELVDAYWEDAKVYYKGDPLKSNGHLHSLRGAVRLLVRLYGDLPLSQFGPLKFAMVRDQMIEPKLDKARRRVVDPVTGGITTAFVEIQRPGWARGYINSQVKRLKRMFAWGVARELVPPQIYHALVMVEGLRKGKTLARESLPVGPAGDDDIQKVLPLLPPPVKSMIMLEAITGMRPGEVRIMRACDIDTGTQPWIYSPQWHKTEHHGSDHTREIFLGPRAQEILKPYLSTLSYLFAPKDSDAWVRAQRRNNRKTPMTPSQLSRALNSAGRERKFHPFYTKDSFAQCVRRACVRAGLSKGFHQRLGSGNVPAPTGFQGTASERQGNQFRCRRRHGWAIPRGLREGELWRQLERGAGRPMARDFDPGRLSGTGSLPGLG